MAKSRSTVTLTCMDCGCKQAFTFCSPAAPVLTACEESERHGWSYTVGFCSMLTGNHENRCKACTEKLNALS